MDDIRARGTCVTEAGQNFVLRKGIGQVCDVRAAGHVRDGRRTGRKGV